MSDRMERKGLHRRKFLQSMAATVGLSLLPGSLAACGTEPEAATKLVPTIGEPTVSTPNPTIKIAPTAKSATGAVGTTSVSTPTNPTAAQVVPAGYTQVGKITAPNNPPAKFSSGKVTGFIFMKSATQPVVFSNICTHQGCGVAYSNAEKKIICPCHGSEYNNTGQVIKGPASLALEQFDSKVIGDLIFARLPG